MATKEPDDPRFAPVDAALKRLESAERLVERRKEELGKAIADAIREGLRPAALIKRTDKSAETIRKWARANGVERLREPTVTSIKKASESGDA